MEGRPRKARYLRGGYTLMEMIVVMTIIALITAGVVPVFQGTLTWARGDRAGRDFVALMKYAQETAIAESTEYRFCMNHDEGTYWLMRAAVDDDGDRIYENVDDGYGAKRKLPENVHIKRPNVRYDREHKAHFVAFYASGSCDFATVEVEREGGDGIEINTKGRLGQFEVKET
jgi:prepilin-type N-terminal cleavage/methylation domain-containing protein